MVKSVSCPLKTDIFSIFLVDFRSARVYFIIQSMCSFNFDLDSVPYLHSRKCINDKKLCSENFTQQLGYLVPLAGTASVENVWKIGLK